MQVALELANRAHDLGEAILLRSKHAARTRDLAERAPRDGGHRGEHHERDEDFDQREAA